MSIYCPFCEALGIEATVSILDIPDNQYDEYGVPLPPWNKGKKGLQDNPYKGVKGRYDKKTLALISKNTTKAMSKLSNKKKKEMRERNAKNGQKCWLYNDEGIHKRVDKEQLNEFLSVGWRHGRCLSRDPKTGKFMKP